MPELPEVETVRRGLLRTVVGKTVADVDVRVPKIFADATELIEQVLIGAKITGVDRRAKIILVRLSNAWTLAIHLKMTGQIIVLPPRATTGFVGGHPEKVYEQPLPHAHTHIMITFTDGTKLYYNDLRKFGWMRVLRSEVGDQRLDSTAPTVDQFLDKLELGPEPLGEDFTLEYLTDLLKGRKIPIKQLLLEQKGIAGIGNIYADEALFYAAIHPRRSAASLTKGQIFKLYDGIRHVLALGITHGGTTMNTYRNVDGGQGAMRDHLKVYSRAGEPCFVCGTPIERFKIGQRSSHYCPSCQRK